MWAGRKEGVNMARLRQTYSAALGEETIQGTADDLAEKIGVRRVCIYDAVSKGQRLHGWLITPQSTYHVVYLAQWHDDYTSKTYTGNCRELAKLLYRSQTEIRRLADSGKPSVDGWTITRITERG